MTYSNLTFVEFLFPDDPSGVANLGTRIGREKIGEVSFEQNDKKLNICTFKLVNLEKSIIDKDGLQEDTAFVIRYGVYNRWSVEKSLIIKEVKVTYGASISADIIAHDQRSKSVIQKSGQVWSNKTASEIVVSICKQFGWDTTRVVTTTKKYKHIAAGGKSLSQVIMELAWQEQFRYSVEKDACIFEPAFDFSGKLNRTFTYWVTDNPNIIQFSVGSKTSDPSKGAGVDAKKLDPKTGKPSTATSSGTPTAEKTPRQLKLAYKSSGGYEVTPQETAKSGATDAHPDADKKRADAKQTHAAWKFSEANLECINEQVDTGDVVTIQGTAVKHEGLYQVKSSSIKYNGGHLHVSAVLSRDIKKDTKKKDKTDKTKASTPNGGGAPPKAQISYKSGGGYEVAKK